ncbi:MAG: hypothetical protein K5694_00590 [Bacilli bacterium]|nr:hypothetical protein [Bacilli bacterium]
MVGGDTACSGYHHVQSDPTVNANGVKEYWACCEHHEIYYSTKSIPNYDPDKWTDGGSTPGEETKLDDRNLDKLLSSAATTSGGFSASNTDGVVTIQGTTQSGSYLSDDEYSNCSFTVSFSEKASHNPYFDDPSSARYTNSLIVCGVDHGSYISGYYIDVCESFTSIYTIKPDGSKTESQKAQYTGVIDTFNVQLADGSLKVIKPSDSSVLIQIETWPCPAGGIGFHNENGNSASITISNFSTGLSVERTPFANATFNNGNNWTASNDASQIVVGSTGHIISNDSYTNFHLSLSMTNYPTENLYSTHNARNAIVIGGNVASGIVSGYVVEFHQEFVMFAKLSGLDNMSTDGCISDTYITNNKSYDGTFDIWVSGTYIRFRSGNNFITYGMSDYVGGKVGYLANPNDTDWSNTVTAKITA